MRVYHRTRFGAISYRPRILGIFLIAGVLLPTLVAGMWQAFIGLAVAGVVLLAFLRVSHRQHTETVNCVWCRYDSAQAIQSEARQERKAQTAAKRAEILTQGDGGWPITVIGAVVPAMPLVAGIIGHQRWVYGPAAVLLAGWWMYRAHLRQMECK
jgi:hypothetical protein